MCYLEVTDVLPESYGYATRALPEQCGPQVQAETQCDRLQSLIVLLRLVRCQQVTRDLTPHTGRSGCHRSAHSPEFPRLGCFVSDEPLYGLRQLQILQTGANDECKREPRMITE